LLFFLYFFFFFQAEDGIRDFHVTGVQTCALPISGGALLIGRAGRSRRGVAKCPCRRSGSGVERAVEVNATSGWLEFGDAGGSPRSEERRVGKECRYRWSPYY